jgi:hypothetical protein
LECHAKALQTAHQAHRQTIRAPCSEAYM